MNAKAMMNGLFAMGLWFGVTTVNAANVSVTSYYDDVSGEIEVDLYLTQPPQQFNDLKFTLDYTSTQATFNRAEFPEANVTSYSSSKAGASGQVTGSATIDFGKGNSPVRLYFTINGQGSIDGVFNSITLGGVELGPATLSPFSFNGASNITPPTGATSAPTNLIVSGLNRSVAVHWMHATDTVKGFLAQAWLLSGTGQRIGPVAGCDGNVTDNTCVIENLNNGRVYVVTVSALYPDGTVVSSTLSPPVIPFPSIVNGSCNPNVGTTALTRALIVRQMCKTGRLSGYSSDGITSSWSCVGLGHGGTQTCTAP